MAMTNNAHSDLVHLFIDGEATETERNALFGALKDSPELQEELSSAMQLKQAFAADISKLQPPSYLESQIAERAGLIVAASASLATAPVVVNSISSAVSSMAPIAATGISKGILALIIGTSVGVLSTIGIIKLSNSDETPIATAPATVSQNISTGNAQAPLLVAVDKPAVIKTPDATYLMNKANTSTPENLYSAAKLPNVKVSEAVLNHVSNAIRSKAIVKDTKVVSEAPKEKLPVASENSTNNSTVINKKEITEVAMQPISLVMPRIADIKANASIGSNRESMHTNEMYDGGLTGFGRLSARVAGIMTSKLYQGNSNATTPVLNNFAVGLKFDLDHTNALGAEVGNETFPIYLSNRNGGYDNHTSISWYGLSWTYSAIYLPLPFDIHPEFRILGAESTAGPIAKFSAGLVLPITPRLSFSLDGEETMLFIQSNGANLTGNKLALTGAFTFHF